MSFPISLNEYRMRYPDTAEFSTLSQSGVLAALLQVQRFKVARHAHQQAKRQSRCQRVRSWWKRWRAKLRLPAAHLAGPTSARIVRQS